MTGKPVSPFSGLDKALLRSTQREPAAPARPQAEEVSSPTSPTPEVAREKQVRARMQARTDVPAGKRIHAPSVEQFYRKLQAKQRLASSTFRFRPEELEELDRVFAQLAQANPGKLSKNDLVRLGLNWLLADYEKNGRESVLAQVLART